MGDKPRPPQAVVEAVFSEWMRRELEEPPMPEVGVDDLPGVTTLAVRTYTPDKWRLVDTDSGEVWSWNGERWIIAGMAIQPE